MTKYFAIGVVAGVIAGVAIGVLFAPRKGSDTRRQIAQAREDFGVFISEKLDSTKGVYYQLISLGKAET